MPTQRWPTSTTSSLKSKITSGTNLDSRKFTSNSVANRTAILNKWADHLGATEVRTITTDDLQDWYSWLKTRKTELLTESTAHSYLLMVRGLFNQKT